MDTMTMTTSESATPTGEPTDSTAETAEIPTDALEAPPEGDGTGEHDGNDANAERRTRRLKYRAADTALAVANARIETQNRLHAERVLATKLADVDDAWVNGADLAELLDDVGLVDDAKVLAFAEELVARKPHLAARLKPLGAPASAVNGDDPIPSKGNTPSWQDILTGGKTG
jgi:hypothetical protein